MQLKRNKEMEFETLRKSYKKQIAIGALAVCVIGGTLTFNLTRAKYKITESIDLAKGTINYKPYDFKIMAMYKSEDGTNYTEIETMPSSDYIINEDKAYCTIDNKIQVKGKAYTNDAGELVLKNLTKSDKCYLYFDRKITAEDMLTKLNITNIKSGTPTFSNLATTDEGVYSAADGMYGGTSYYWRGAVTNNYIRFANFCWRIIRINGNGSIRLIYDGTTCHANGTNTAESIAKANIVYNTKNNQSNYVGWTYEDQLQRPVNNATGTSSNAKTQLESWYSSNLVTYTNRIADGKFCNDRDVSSGNVWAISPSSSFSYAASNRTSAEAPTLGCLLEDVYILKVGLITADEARFAGANGGNDNSKYYLYNGQTYWTMSPYDWWSNSAATHVIHSSGSIGGGHVHNTLYGLRPVINIKSNVTFSGGDGTLNNPYVVE